MTLNLSMFTECSSGEIALCDTPNNRLGQLHHKCKICTSMDILSGNFSTKFSAGFVGIFKTCWCLIEWS